MITLADEIVSQKRYEEHLWQLKATLSIAV